MAPEVVDGGNGVGFVVGAPVHHSRGGGGGAESSTPRRTIMYGTLIA